MQTGEAPHFKHALTTLNITLGQPFKLEAELEPAESKPSFKWYKNEVEITDMRYMYVDNFTMLLHFIKNYVGVQCRNLSVVFSFSKSLFCIIALTGCLQNLY